MNKIKLLVLSFSFLFFITGCTTDENTNLENDYKTEGFKHITCTRDAYTTDENTTVSINYDLYYDDEGYLQILKSKEEIVSSNSDILTQYEEAYKSIYELYENIDYYTNKVTRDDNKVISTTSINYGKVDMDKIMEIEGEEDNVKVENGKIKLSDWKSFAKEYGTTCSD